MDFDVKDFLDNDIVKSVGIVCAALVIGFGSTKLIRQPVTRLANEIAVMNSDISKINNQLIALKASDVKDKQKVVTEITGADLSRVDSDITYIKEFLSEAFTWSTYEEYIAVRDKMPSKYGISSTSDFFTVFMPYIKNVVNAGKNINVIDTTGLNMAYENAKITLVSIENANYVYMVECNVVSKDNVSNLSNTESVALLLSVEPNTAGIGVKYVAKLES